MFCPKCKSIISKKRINNQIVEFCNCPDKLESNYIVQTVPEKKAPRQSTKITSEGKVLYKKVQSTMKFTTIQESTFKPKREASEYSKIPLDLRISKNARLPAFWKQQQVQNRLLKQTEELYERYYRKIEDFFSDTELKFFISLIPNDTLSDFSVDHWGLGFKAKDEFSIFYSGTKLNDLAAFDSKVLEKESDLILPYRLFKGFSRKLDFDKLTFRQLLEILKNDWSKYKENTPEIIFQPFSIDELFTYFKRALFT